jgi:hypothetical protein
VHRRYLASIKRHWPRCAGSTSQQCN